jgi:hypothetical protein
MALIIERRAAAKASNWLVVIACIIHFLALFVFRNEDGARSQTASAGRGRVSAGLPGMGGTGFVAR